MPGFAEMKGVAVGPDGKADPQQQLFRNSAIGAETGPMISQVQCRTSPVSRKYMLIPLSYFVIVRFDCETTADCYSLAALRRTRRLRP